MHQPLLPHWQAVKRILHYLKNTISHGLLFAPYFSMNLSAYSNSDWVGDQHDRRSTNAYYIFLATNLVSWSSHKQLIVARCST
jgi:hypothetical protein